VYQKDNKRIQLLPIRKVSTDRLIERLIARLIAYQFIFLEIYTESETVFYTGQKF
jgi:hypothetical protein